MCYQCKIILVVSISWLYHCNIHYKDVVKHSNVGQKFSYVLLALSLCVLIRRYLHVAGLDLGLSLGLRLLVLTSTSTSEFRPRTWPRPPPLGSDLDLGLRVSASDLASVFWPRLTSLTERLLSSPFTVLHSNVYVLSSIWWRHLVNISYIQ